MRILIEALDLQFVDINRRQRELLDKTPKDKLFWTPIAMADSLILTSVGGAILRSGAMVEQAFLGLTRRLWDDPFEWTLPEKLSTKDAVAEYLGEVVAARTMGLTFLVSDADLTRQVPAPEKLKTILAVLVESIARSENCLGRGETVYRLISDQH
jgi:hypothetical protein